MEALEQKKWWEYVEGDLQKLFLTSQYLIDMLLKIESTRGEEKALFDDYAFVVFPAAKAYEGFLKKLFFDLRFITEEDYTGKHFRIGKSLNPSLPRDVRNHQIYGKIVEYCGGKELADQLWETWRVCRNLTFHWFPEEKNAISLSESIDRVNMIVSAIDASFEECRVNTG